MEIDAGDPVLICGFCRTALYMVPSIALRYMLPAKTPPSARGKIFYVPYWRFRGLRYRALPEKIDGFVMDSTWIAIRDLEDILENTLGIKPQAMPLTLSVDASFLALPDIDMETGLKKTKTNMETWLRGKPLFDGFIGESVCLIYVPCELLRDEKDGFLIKTLCINSSPNRIDEETGSKIEQKLKRHATKRAVQFLPLICPECGHDLPRSKGAVILRCTSCDMAWRTTGGRYDQVPFIHIPAPAGQAEQAIHIPFWKITMSLNGFPAETRAQFKGLVISYQKMPEEWDSEPVTIIIPAIKLNPGLLLRVARGLTLFSGKRAAPSNSYKERRCLSEAVTISSREASEAIKIIMASIFAKRKKLAALIKDSEIAIQETTLIYLPFLQGPHDLKECYSGQAIPVRALDLGKNI